MSGAAWISSMFSNYALGDKPGVRAKLYGEDWEAATFEQGRSSADQMAAINKYVRGFKLERNELPETAAVWHQQSFARMGELFATAGFYVVRKKLHDVLSRFDLGEGELVPFTIYEADLETPLDEEFWLLNFGAIKETFLPEQSENVKKGVVRKATGQQLWKINGWAENDDVALSREALSGPDLWFEEVVSRKIFLSDALVQALTEAKLADAWQLTQCRVIGEPA